MSSTGKTNEAGAMQAGDFRAVIRLYPNNGETISHRDITEFVTDFEISEGLNQSSLVAKLKIRDAVNLLEDMRITGSEKIDIVVYQDEDIEGQEEPLLHQIGHSFHISDVINYSRNLGVQTYQFQLVSRTAYLNQLDIKNNSFSNAVGEEVQLILDELMRGYSDDSDKPNMFINKGGGNFKGCYPHLRPISAINWLKRNAFDRGSPFFFFESLNYNKGEDSGKYNKKMSSIVFESFTGFTDDIANKSTDGKLNLGENTYHMSPYSNNREDLGSRSKIILGVATNLGMSKFNQIGAGAYGSRLTTVDIATKTVKEIDYGYKEKGQPSLLVGNMYKPFATTDRAKFNNQTLDEYQGRRFYSSINTLAMEGKKNYHSPLEDESDQLQKCTSIIANLNYMQHEITLWGDFNLFTGSIIYIEIPKSADPEIVEPGAKLHDELQSGIYLVTGIKHIFKDNEYKMKVNIAKDASMLDLDSKTPPTERKTG